MVVCDRSDAVACREGFFQGASSVQERDGRHPPWRRHCRSSRTVRVRHSRSIRGRTPPIASSRVAPAPFSDIGRGTSVQFVAACPPPIGGREESWRSISSLIPGRRRNAVVTRVVRSPDTRALIHASRYMRHCVGCPPRAALLNPRSPSAHLVQCHRFSLCDHRFSSPPTYSNSKGCRVESGTGAPTVGSGGGSVAFASGLSPAPMVTFPVPAHRTVRADFPHTALGRDHAFAHGKLTVRGAR